MYFMGLEFYSIFILLTYFVNSYGNTNYILLALFAYFFYFAKIDYMSGSFIELSVKFAV